jgi:hypothetical protein
MLLLYTAVTHISWLVADSVINALFAFDIFVNLNSAYMDEDRNIFIANRKVIAKHYIEGWFLIDFI